MLTILAFCFPNHKISSEKKVQCFKYMRSYFTYWRWLLFFLSFFFLFLKKPLVLQAKRQNNKQLINYIIRFVTKKTPYEAQ